MPKGAVPFARIKNHLHSSHTPTLRNCFGSVDYFCRCTVYPGHDDTLVFPKCSKIPRFTLASSSLTQNGETVLVTDKFVFLHLPRSGGTFVYEVVKKFFPSAHEIGYHFPRALLPREYLHLPLLGTVRNPWEFYVSWYHYHGASETYSSSKNILFWCVSEDRKLNFSDTIRNALNLGASDEKLDLLIRSLPQNYDYQKRKIPNLTNELMLQIRGSGLGLYSFRFNQMFGHANDVFLCRVETLRNDLMTFFERIGVASNDLRQHVLREDKKNISTHRHYSTYYTPELRELVSIRDRQLIDRFDFSFETRT